jgi:hypothetical protein
MMAGYPCCCRALGLWFFWLDGQAANTSTQPARRVVRLAKLDTTPPPIFAGNGNLDLGSDWWAIGYDVDQKYLLVQDPSQHVWEYTRGGAPIQKLWGTGTDIIAHDWDVAVRHYDWGLTFVRKRSVSTFDGYVYDNSGTLVNSAALGTGTKSQAACIDQNGDIYWLAAFGTGRRLYKNGVTVCDVDMANFLIYGGNPVLTHDGTDIYLSATQYWNGSMFVSKPGFYKIDQTGATIPTVVFFYEDVFAGTWTTNGVGIVNGFIWEERNQCWDAALLGHSGGAGENGFYSLNADLSRNIWLAPYEVEGSTSFHWGVFKPD